MKGKRRPRANPPADRAYDSDGLATRRAKANIKPMQNRVNIPKFNKKLYRKSKRCFPDPL
jgi:hypothetical protein